MKRTFTGFVLPGMKYLSLWLMFLFFTGTVCAQESYSSLKEKIDYKAASTDASSLLQYFQEHTGYTFSFDHDALSKLVLKDIDFSNTTLGSALQYLHNTYQLRFSLAAAKNIAVRYQPAAHKESGHITGQVLDAKTNDPVIGATVQSGSHGTVTDVTGQYDLELPEGTYTLVISSIGYVTKRITDVVSTDAKPFVLPVSLETQKGTLKQVEVVASARRESIAALYLRQKNNVAVSDGISAEQIRVTPDNNTAQVLKRVSGLTIQEDKFVTVRGLSDRYNNVLLNGAVLPSTEPNRRNFSFDIIPSGLIDNIQVNKTATPDMASEFAGGLVQINTKDLPDENFFSLTVGSGYNTNSVGRSMYSTHRGKNDYLGYDDGARNWWNQGWNKYAYSAAYADGNYAKMGEMNQLIPNHWGLRTFRYSPVQNYQLSLGKKIKAGKNSNIGITGGALYRHEEIIEDEERNTYWGDQYDFKGNTYNFRSALSGIVNVTYQQQGHKISLKNLYSHLFNNETNIHGGSMVGFGGGDARVYTNITLLNDIWQHRLEGEHALGRKGIKLDWAGDWVRSERDQPDTRNMLGFVDSRAPEGFYYYVPADKTGFLGRGASLFNSHLKENRYNWAANLTVPFTVAGQKQKIRAGYAGTYRDADYASIGLMAVRDGSNPDFDRETTNLPDYELFDKKFMKPGYLFYFPTGPNSASIGASGEEYVAFQRLQAAYLMADLSLPGNIRLAGGVRMEDNYMDINTEALQNGRMMDTSVVYKKKNWLPSVNLIYSLTPKMNVRLAYAETLSRPDFRERSPFIYYEFKQRAQYRGTYGLKDASITNYDLRYEWYPKGGEIMSASLFYKKFESPVELVVGGTPAGNEVYYYFNLRSSTSMGVEVDFRKSLDFINPASKVLNNIYISGNASWMKANVKYNTQEMLDGVNDATGGGFQELPPDSRDRPVQGLSPYIINAGVGYFGWPVGINLSYNRSGPRIVVGGLYPGMDQYENPRDVLDLQLSTRLLKNKLDIRLNISDLLQQSYIIYENGGPAGISKPDENPNNDPRGKRYNPDLDYTRFKSFRGSNISLNIGYQF